MAGPMKYIQTLSSIMLMPYPNISDSESISAYCNNVSDANKGVNINFTDSLKVEFSLS